MSDYRLASEDDHSFTLKHPDGSHFKIAKMALQQAMLDKIRGFQRPQKMSEGGIAGYDDNSSSQPSDEDTVNQLIGQSPVTENSDAEDSGVPIPLPPGYDHSGNGGTDLLNAVTSLKNGVGGALDSFSAGLKGQPLPGEAPSGGIPAESPLNSIPSSTSAQSQAVQTSSPGMPGTAELNPDYRMAGSGLMKQGIQAIADAKSAEANATVKAIDSAQKAQKDLTDQFAGTFKEIGTQADNAKKAYINGTLDPNRIWKTKEEGGEGANKTLATIAIILGGIGSGLTGGPNMALEVINKRIDRDIDAQKNEQGKNLNLYQMMREKYSDTKQAELATRMQYNAAFQAQLLKAAAVSGSAQAQGNAKIALGQLSQQQAQYQHQMATLQMMAGIKANGVSAAAAPLIAQFDPKMGEQLVPVGDRAYQARTPEDAKELKKSEALYQPIQNEIKFLQSVGSGVLNPETRARALASLNRLGMQVNEFNGYNRFTEVDAHTIQNQFNDPTKIASIFQGKGATADTLRALQNKLESERRTRLWGYGGPSSYKTYKSGLGR